MIFYENTIAKITRQRCYQYNYISKWESDKKMGRSDKASPERQKP